MENVTFLIDAAIENEKNYPNNYDWEDVLQLAAAFKRDITNEIEGFLLVTFLESAKKGNAKDAEKTIKEFISLVNYGQIFEPLQLLSE